MGHEQSKKFMKLFETEASPEQPNLYLVGAIASALAEEHLISLLVNVCQGFANGGDLRVGLFVLKVLFGDILQAELSAKLVLLGEVLHKGQNTLLSLLV